MSRRLKTLLLVGVVVIAALGVAVGVWRWRSQLKEQSQIVQEEPLDFLYVRGPLPRVTPHYLAGVVVGQGEARVGKRLYLDVGEGFRRLPLDTVGFVGPFGEGDLVHTIVSDHPENGAYRAYAFGVDVPYPYRSLRSHLRSIGLRVAVEPRMSGVEFAGAPDAVGFRLSDDDDRPRIFGIRLETARVRNRWLSQWVRAEREVPGAVAYLYAYDDDEYLVVYLSDERNPAVNAATQRILRDAYGGPRRFEWSQLPVWLAR